MKKYTYRAKNVSGKVISGETHAKNADVLRSQLQEKGYTGIEILESKNNRVNGYFRKRVNLKALGMFCRQFSIVLQAGVPIAQALDVLRTQTEHRTLRAVLDLIYESMQKGISLSNSMRQQKGVFPELMVNMVEAGEASGKLEEVFVRLADTYEKEAKLNRKIISSLIYPVVILVVAVIIVGVLMLYVVPQFVSILSNLNTELPKLTKILIGISDFFKNHWLKMFIASLLGGFGIRQLLMHDQSKEWIHSVILRTPVLGGVMMQIITARFTRTLSVLLASGVLLIQSMEMVKKIIGNKVIQNKVSDVIEDIKKGKGLYGPLRKIDIFPPMVTSMVKIGEESGELDFSLKKCADFYDEEVEAGLQRLTTLIEPLVIIGVAIVVGFIVLSVLLPMLSMIQNIENL